VEDKIRRLSGRRDGLLNRTETLDALRYIIPEYAKEDETKIFDELDTDHDERISVDDLMKHFEKKKRGQRAPPPPPKKSARGRGRSLLGSVMQLLAFSVVVGSLAVASIAVASPTQAAFLAAAASVLGALACCGRSWSVAAFAVLACVAAHVLDPIMQERLSPLLEAADIGIDVQWKADGQAALPAQPQMAWVQAGQFKYLRDWDRNGILYYLGTHQGQTAWENPADKGLVEVTLSSIAEDNDPEHCRASNAVAWASDERAPPHVRTRSEHNPWVAFDFGPSWRVSPTHYTLRHGGAGRGELPLRNWVIEGLEEGRENLGFQVLREHTGDKGLQGRHASASWPIPERAEGAAPRAFRVLRVRDTSPGKSVLHAGGFEVYGTLLRRAKAEPAAAAR